MKFLVLNRSSHKSKNTLISNILFHIQQIQFLWKIRSNCQNQQKISMNKGILRMKLNKKIVFTRFLSIPVRPGNRYRHYMNDPSRFSLNS
jgi:hypothetical protein